jgi:hypothetical protein
LRWCPHPEDGRQRAVEPGHAITILVALPRGSRMAARVRSA